MGEDYCAFAEELAAAAGRVALEYFRRPLKVDDKAAGVPGKEFDPVTEADRAAERLMREMIAARYPDHGIAGEEFADTNAGAELVWVLDPIDGTANFVNGIPAWSVVIACVTEADTVLGVIHEPNSRETFAATLGGGATLNGKPMRASAATRLTEGSIGTGLSNRVDWQPIVAFIADLMANGGVFFRNASGAIMLAYVASGRLLGYVEQHMNAWDCAAGLLMVREAGGLVHRIGSAELLDKGSMIITGATGVYDEIERMARAAFTPAAAPVPPPQS